MKRIILFGRVFAVLLMLSAFFVACASVPRCDSGDCQNGKGSATYSDGNKYVGEWKDGKRNGKGKYTFANGNNYDGEWKNNKYHGKGTFTQANGANFTTEWVNGKPAQQK